VLSREKGPADLEIRSNSPYLEREEKELVTVRGGYLFGSEV